MSLAVATRCAVGGDVVPPEVLESGCYRFISNGVMPQIIRKTIKPAFTPDGYGLLRGFRPVTKQP